MTPSKVRNDLILCAIMELKAILAASMYLYIEVGSLEPNFDYNKQEGRNLAGKFSQRNHNLKVETSKRQVCLHIDLPLFDVSTFRLFDLYLRSSLLMRPSRI